MDGWTTMTESPMSDISLSAQHKMAMAMRQGYVEVSAKLWILAFKIGSTTYGPDHVEGIIQSLPASVLSFVDWR